MIFLLYASGQQVFASGQQAPGFIEAPQSPRKEESEPTRSLTESDGIILITV